ncbi:multicopper oxidase domain-containing protein [Sporosarcina aquimarina]|uniref:multicopper oxidase family protein n=1 Tax=Sporosarcina aquimarina TaxID=114975 RepID=UPI002040778A|nr:multicopper oxidase domain-containing protein [Sporosarcina aquimarina]MCM3758493.1 multicopper oxidase domain-containing protein [Sporosarcina aquimarina]
MKIMMKWLTLTLISSLIAGCSMGGVTEESKESSPENVMNHDMSGMEGMMDGHMGHNNPLALKGSKGVNELSIPPLLAASTSENVDYTLTAQKGKRMLLEGQETETYGYNGDFLGPVLKLRKGESVRIKTVNDLDEDTTFHWHGLDVPGDVDGGPHNPLKPGEERIIQFKVTQEAATLWFHPHPHGKTAEQVYKGLAGLLYIEDEHSDRLNLPDDYGVNDFPVLMQDRAFTPIGELDYEAAYNSDGTLGDRLLVNGTLDPKLSVPQGKVRLRLLNGSNARNYTISLSSGDTFQQIATDGGLLNDPLEMDSLLLTPAERAEIIIDFDQLQDVKDLALVDDQGTILLPFEVNEKKTSNKLPADLNSFAVTEEERNLPVTKRLELFGMMDMVTINGKKFDKDRIDMTQKVGETEVWELSNKPDPMGGMIHPFHIHGTQFKVLSVNGEEPDDNLKGWKDTIALHPGDRVKIAISFANKGVYMYHCHILEHEDNGMMGQIEVN